jgi:hypothetical protein
VTQNDPSERGAEKEIETMTPIRTKHALLGCVMFVCGAMVASLASARPRQAVEHTPTVEQCRADQRVWLATLQQSHDVTDVTFPTLRQWTTEMQDCTDIDNVNAYKYLNTLAEARAVQMTRLLRFIQRHNLIDQFKAEDAEGKR